MIFGDDNVEIMCHSYFQIENVANASNLLGWDGHSYWTSNHEGSVYYATLTSSKIGYDKSGKCIPNSSCYLYHYDSDPNTAIEKAEFKTIMRNASKGKYSGLIKVTNGDHVHMTGRELTIDKK